jgi:protease I
MKKILIPLPAYGFDPTESAIPWKVLTTKGVEIVFASPEGKMAACDQKMLTGESLGVWKKLLQAREDAVDAYRSMQKSPSFCQPLSYRDLQNTEWDALVLPGGHDKGVREYLESPILQRLTADFFAKQKPVAAICHGVVLAARSLDPLSGKSVLFDYKTTALLRSQERGAFLLTRLWLKDYYLTYPSLTVEEEVKSALADPSQFIHGPPPLLRDDPTHPDRGFIVRDRKYLSARWPGDAYRFAQELLSLLEIE